MIDDRLFELEKELDLIIKQIIFDLRPKKRIDEELFNKLYEKLGCYTALIKGSAVISRTVSGELFYLFSTMIVEAKYMKFDNKIMGKIFRLRIYMLNVYDENILG